MLGPEDLSFNDMAQIMSEVLGRPVRFQQIPGEAIMARLTELGMSRRCPGVARHDGRQERGSRHRRDARSAGHHPACWRASHELPNGGV